jgi:hypothetical protein
MVGMNRQVAGHQRHLAGGRQVGGLGGQPGVGGMEVVGEQQPDVAGAEGLAQPAEQALGEADVAGQQRVGDGALAPAGEHVAAAQAGRVDVGGRAARQLLGGGQARPALREGSGGGTQ